MEGERREQVYLVTGGAGFLGAHLVKMLVERGVGIREVRVFDQIARTELESLSTGRVRVRCIVGDVRKVGDVQEAAKGVTLIIHSASLIDVWGHSADPLIWGINYRGTQNVVEACKDLGIQYLVYTSSMEAVGPNTKGDHFIRGDEDTPYNVQPEGAYARSKAKAEQLVLRSNGTKVAGGMTLYTCVLRPTGIYGEGNAVMEKLYRQLVKFGRRRLRLARKEVEHGRVYVGNVAWMHLLAARGLQERPDVMGGEAYFCYDDSPYLSFEEFDMQFLGGCGFRMVGVGEAPLPSFALYLLAFLSQWVCWILRPLLGFRNFLNVYILRMITTSFTVSTDKAGRHFGYSPAFSWEESRNRTLGWVRQLDAAPPRRQ